MSNQRYAPGFKDGALRQVVERGYSVTEVTVLIGSYLSTAMNTVIQN